MLNLQSDSTQQSSDESDIRRLQELNSQLRQKNEKLSLEISSLRSQFNEATAIGSQLEQIHQKNSKLATDLRNVTIERDELSHRLDINIQMIDELRAAKEQEKREAERRIQTEINDASETYEKNFEELTNKYNKSQNELKEALKSLQNIQNENESLSNSIKSAVEAAQTYFVQPIKTLDQLTSQLQEKSGYNYNLNQENNPNPQKFPEGNLNIQELQKQIKNIKQKAKEERRLRKDAEKHISELEEKIQECQKELESSKSKNESIITDLKRQLELAELQKNSITTSSEKRISDLKMILEKERSKNQPLSASPSTRSLPAQESLNSTLQSKINSQETKLKEAQASIFSLRKQNATLISQISETENTKELLQRKLQSANEESEQCRKLNDEIKSELTSLTMERDDLKEQLETALAQVEAARSSFNQSKSAFSEASCQIDKLRNAVNISESMVSKQREEIANLVKDRNQCINSIHKQNEALVAAEEMINRLIEENKEVKKTLNIHLKTIRETEVVPKSEEIPPTSWFCIDFPRPLCASISDIAQNPALPTTAKLRNVLTTIAKYYNKQLEELNTEKENLSEKLNGIVDKFDHFFISLGPIVEDQTLNGENFLNDTRKETTIIKYLTDLQNFKIGKKLENAQLDKEITDVLNRLNVKALNEVPSAIDQLINLNDQYKKGIESLKSNQKKMAKAVKLLKAANHEITSEKKKAEEEHQQIVSQLEEEKNALKDEINGHQRSIFQLRSQMDDITNSNSALITARNDECNDQFIHMKSEHEQAKKEYLRELETKSQKVEELTEKVEKLEHELNQWKKTSEMLKASKIEKEQQLQTLLTQIDDNEKENRLKIEAVKAELKDQYEKSVSQIKAKNNQLRELVSNVSSALNESEERNKNLLASNSQLAMEKQQLLAKVDTLTEEQTRERQLTEAKLKTLELSLTTQRQMDLEDERARLEEEKRKIYGVMASNFHNLFDARQQLNDAGYKAFVEKCAAEMTKLARQDANLRRLLGLGATESVEDAVQKLLLSLYH